MLRQQASSVFVKMLRLTLLAQLSLLSIWNLQFYHPLGVPSPRDVEKPTQSHHHLVMQTGAWGVNFLFLLLLDSLIPSECAVSRKHSDLLC